MFDVKMQFYCLHCEPQQPLQGAFNTKGGLGYCNLAGAMSGVKMIAFLNGSTTNKVSSQIYKFLDDKAIDIIKTRTKS
jgi:hypothetical protein